MFWELTVFCHSFYLLCGLYTSHDTTPFKVQCMSVDEIWYLFLWSKIKIFLNCINCVKPLFFDTLWKCFMYFDCIWQFLSIFQSWRQTYTCCIEGRGGGWWGFLLLINIYQTLLLSQFIIYNKCLNLYKWFTNLYCSKYNRCICQHVKRYMKMRKNRKRKQNDK